MKRAAVLTLLLAVLVVAGVLLFGAYATRAGGAPLAPAGDEADVVVDPEVQRIYGQNFGLEILVNGRPLEEYAARGRRYIEAIEGAEYEVRVSNPLPVRVAVALSVDGLNTIDAQRTTGWNASKWVIQPYETITIKGWQMSSARARHFYFTTERDSYASKIGKPGNQGTISAVFFREREAPRVVTPPYYENQKRREMGSARNKDERADAEPARRSSQAGAVDKAAPSASSSAAAPPAPDEYAATGIGRSVRHDVQWVNLDLHSQPAAQLAVRYEYRPQLIRLGVLPRPHYPQPDPLERRERSTGFDRHTYSPEP